MFSACEYRFLKKSFQAVKSVLQLPGAQLGLDAGDDGLELLFRQIHAGELFQGLYRVALEVFQKGGVFLKLFDQLIHFFLDIDFQIHDESSCNKK